MAAATKSGKGPPKAPKRLRPTNVRFDDDMLDELKRHARLEDRTTSNLIYRIVRTWLDANRHLLRAGEK